MNGKVFQQIDARVGDARMKILEGVNLAIPKAKNPKRVRLEQLSGLERAAMIVREEKENFSHDVNNRMSSARAVKIQKAVEMYRQNGVFHTIATVRSIAGGSLRKVSEILNSAGVKTPRGSEWVPSIVAQVEETMLLADISLSDCIPLPAAPPPPLADVPIDEQIRELFLKSGLDSKNFQAVVKRVTDDQIDWVG